MSHARLAALAVLLAAIGIAPLAAQPASAPRSGYGTDDLQVLTLSHVAFLPTSSLQTYLSFCCAADSYRRPTGGIEPSSSRLSTPG